MTALTDTAAAFKEAMRLKHPRWTEVKVLDIADALQATGLWSEPTDGPAGVGTLEAVAAASEGRRSCLLGLHAWVPWVTIQHPDGTGQIMRYETWCCRPGCNHSEQYDV
jgi:hypothetical protein